MVGAPFQDGVIVQRIQYFFSLYDFVGFISFPMSLPFWLNHLHLLLYPTCGTKANDFPFTFHSYRPGFKATLNVAPDEHAAQ